MSPGEQIPGRKGSCLRNFREHKLLSLASFCVIAFVVVVRDLHRDYTWSLLDGGAEAFRTHGTLGGPRYSTDNLLSKCTLTSKPDLTMTTLLKAPISGG